MPTLSTSDSILAMGDSLTYGFCVPSNQSYPSYLAAMSGHTVINAGINGETSLEGLKRLPKLLEDPSIKTMILCLGANDILQGSSITKLKKNLKLMVQMAKEKGIKVLLISVPNFSPFDLSDLALYEEVAKEENISLGSGILTQIVEDRSLNIDQVHPNALGYKKIAKMVYASLKEEELIP